MRKFLIMLMVIFILPQSAFAARDTEERLDQGGIVKKIDIPEGQQWAFVDVTAVVDSKPATVWGMLKDMSKWPKWLPMSRKVGFLSPEAAALITPEIAADEAKTMAIDKAHPATQNQPDFSGHWQRTAYEYYDLPWPIKNEWVVRRYTYDETPEKDRAAWKKLDSKLEEDDGYWDVSPRPDGKTLLKYHYRVKAKESVPRPIFKAAVSLTVNSMIKALRHEAGRRDAQVSSQQ